MNHPAATKGSRTPQTLIQPGKVVIKDLVLRALIGLLNLGALGTLWWSLQFRLLPLQHQTRELEGTVGRLTREVDSMESSCAPPVAREIREKFDQIQAPTFKDRAELESWLTGLQQEVIPLALDLEVDLAGAPPPPATNAPAGPIPTRALLTVRPAAEFAAEGTAFQRVLWLSHRLTRDEKRADLTGLTAAGGTNSIGRASLELTLWTRQEEEHP